MRFKFGKTILFGSDSEGFTIIYSSISVSPQMKCDFLSRGSFHSTPAIAVWLSFTFLVKLWFNFNLEISNRHMRPRKSVCSTVLFTYNGKLFSMLKRLRFLLISANQPFTLLCRDFFCLEVFFFFMFFNFFERNILINSWRNVCKRFRLSSLNTCDSIVLPFPLQLLEAFSETFILICF